MNLAELQKKLFGILLEVDKICKENNITYYLAGGTLLGAVRHKGFIPWDDDIDLMMTRTNYDNFLEVAKKSLPDHYFLQCAKNDSEWNYEYTKIRINNTLYSTEFSKQFKNMHQGIFVDIFVQDNTSNKKFMQYIHMKKIQIWHGVVRYKWQRKENKGKRVKVKFPIKALGALVNLNKAKSLYQSIMKKYSSQSTEFLLDSSGMHLNRGAYPAKMLGQPITLPFEDEKFPCPRMYKEYLTYLYGDDYMIPHRSPLHSSGVIK